MKFYSEEETNALESQWWNYIQPTCQENVNIINEWTLKYSEYEEYKQQISDLRSWNFGPDYTVIASLFDGDVVFVKKILTWAEQMIKAEDMEYADNFRVADPLNPDHVILYNKIKSNGCCGFQDSVEVIDGRTVMIGWNYGH